MDLPLRTDEAERTDERDLVEAWVRRQQVRAWRYARLRGCPADLAEDLVQEALMAAVHKGIHRDVDERAAAWLRSAIDNLVAMHRRTEDRRARNVAAALAARAIEQSAGRDDGAAWLTALRGCLDRLDGRARRLLDLHYGHGASREAIAGEFGMHDNGVKAFLRRVRGLLRDCVVRRLRSEPEARP